MYVLQMWGWKKIKKKTYMYKPDTVVSESCMPCRPSAVCSSLLAIKAALCKCWMNYWNLHFRWFKCDMVWTSSRRNSLKSYFGSQIKDSTASRGSDWISTELELQPLVRLNLQFIDCIIQWCCCWWSSNIRTGWVSKPIWPKIQLQLDTYWKVHPGYCECNWWW